MDFDAFRANAHELVDWMADYLERVGERRVVPDVSPGEMRTSFPAGPPEEPEPFNRIIADFHNSIVPGMTHWQHPGWNDTRSTKIIMAVRERENITLPRMPNEHQAP